MNGGVEGDRWKVEEDLGTLCNMAFGVTKFCLVVCVGAPFLGVAVDGV